MNKMGALKPVNVGDKAYGGNSNGSNFRFELDASGANEIFGNSTTVQPPSMALLPVSNFDTRYQGNAWWLNA